MKTISFKVSDDEARYIHSQAANEHVTVSEYLRRRAVQPATVPLPIGRVRCEYTGAEIFAALPSAAPLSTEQVREMLADFP